MKSYLLLLMFIIIAIIGCNKEVITNTPILEIGKVPEDGVVIDKWQLLGPFSADNQEKSIRTDNLECLASKESDIYFDEFIRLSRKNATQNCKLDSSFTNKFIYTGATPLVFTNISDSTRKDITGEYYFACQIRCKKAISTRLHFSSTARAKIWLNNTMICFADYTLPMASYREFIPVDLKKGKNFLLVKVDKTDKNQEMYARLENKSKRSMERYLGIHNHWILNGNILNGDDTLRLDGLFPSCNGEIAIYDRSNNILSKNSLREKVQWKKCIADFEKGDYVVKATVEDITLVQNFFKGDIIDSTQKIINELKQIESTAKIRTNIDALAFRFSHLLKNTYLSDPKFMTLFLQLRDIYVALKKGADPFNHTSGNFIRSYTSEIDTSIQYYILHVPATYQKGKPLPVGITIPVNVYDKFPYLQSFRAANSKLIDFFQDLAEKYNMIIIEPGARRKNQINHNPIEEQELFAILKDVEADYNIDRNRLYLAGTCSGGNELVKMIVKYPDLFAAVGVVAPDIVYVDENTNPWFKTNFPVMFLGNNKQLPIFDTHSIIDRHVPIEASENLNLVAKHFGLKNFKYVKIPNEFPKYYPDDFYDDIFNFTKNYKLNKSPDEVDFTTSQMLYNKSFWVTLTDFAIPAEAHINAKIKGNKLVVKKENITAYAIDLRTLPYNKGKRLTIIDNGKKVFNTITKDSVLLIGPKPKPNVNYKNSTVAGPLADVFSKRFILVKGTSGTKKETEALAALADTINKYWNERYFVNCMIKDDVEVTDKDIAESGLVLLGNQQSNQFLRRLGNTLPLSTSTTGIQIRDKKIEGNKLCFYMVYPNPMNKAKYLAVIGYNNPDCISLGSENNDPYNDVSNYGWYDYKVWNDSPFNDVKLSGYFDCRWN